MQNITLHSHVGSDGMLHLNLPVTVFNTEVEVKLTVKPTQTTKPFPATHLENGLGCIKYHGKTKSLEEMEQGILNAARKQWVDEVEK